MISLFVAQIIEVRLHPSAEDVLTKRAYDEAARWLTQWTPQRNFKAVIAFSETETLQVLREDLLREMVPPHISATPDLFQFRVSMQEAKDGRFWMPSSGVSGTWHDVKVPA